MQVSTTFSTILIIAVILIGYLVYQLYQTKRMRAQLQNLQASYDALAAKHDRPKTASNKSSKAKRKVVQRDYAREVAHYRQHHPEAGQSEATTALNMSRTTVRKYWSQVGEPSRTKESESALQLQVMTTSAD